MEIIDFFDSSKYHSVNLNGLTVDVLIDDKGFKHAFDCGRYKILLKLDFKLIIAEVNSYYGLEPTHGLSCQNHIFAYRPLGVNCISVLDMETDYILMTDFDFQVLSKVIWAYYRQWHPNVIRGNQKKKCGRR